MTRRAVTTEQLRELARIVVPLYESGMSTPEIAAGIDWCSAWTVQRAIREHGPGLRRAGAIPGKPRPPRRSVDMTRSSDPLSRWLWPHRPVDTHGG